MLYFQLGTRCSSFHFRQQCLASLYGTFFCFFGKYSKKRKFCDSGHIILLKLLTIWNYTVLSSMKECSVTNCTHVDHKRAKNIRNCILHIQALSEDAIIRIFYISQKYQDSVCLWLSPINQCAHTCISAFMLSCNGNSSATPWLCVTEKQWSPSSTSILTRSCLLNGDSFINWILRASARLEDLSRNMLNIWIPVEWAVWCSAVTSDLSEMRDFLGIPKETVFRCVENLVFRNIYTQYQRMCLWLAAEWA